MFVVLFTQINGIWYMKELNVNNNYILKKGMLIVFGVKSSRGIEEKILFKISDISVDLYSISHRYHCIVDLYDVSTKYKHHIDSMAWRSSWIELPNNIDKIDILNFNVYIKRKEIQEYLV